MLLTIDAGNTNIVFAVFDGDDLCAKWRIGTNDRRTDDEIGAWVYNLTHMNDIDLSDISDVIIACVVPNLMLPLTRFCKKYIGTEPLIIGSNVKLDMPVRLKNPDEIGADRLVNAVMGVKKYGSPLIIVDFGTATTFDVINKAGEYIGGAISPGINLSLKALHEAASKLPRIGVKKAEQVIGNCTLTAMQSGVFFGYLGLIEGIITRIKREENIYDVLATGGLAELFFNETDAINYIDQDLTIRGLKNIFSNL